MPNTAPPKLTLDLEVYRPYLDDADIPDEDKQALLESLWTVIVSFVRLGWGIDAVSDAVKDRETACGQFAQNEAGSPVSSRSMVELKGLKNPKTFNRAADMASLKASAP